MVINQEDEKFRGAGGQFISKETASNVTPEDLPDLVHKSSKMTGALNDLKEAEEERKLEKPLISVSVNNPISWLLKWINKLKKKQTTTISFRLGVPLIALPVLLFAIASLFFGLGKVTSKQDEKVIEEVPESYEVSKSGILSFVSKNDLLSYYLVLPDGEAILLEPPENIDLSDLEFKRILVTGDYSEENKVIKIQNVTDMEILPSTPKPIPTVVPAPTPTPTPTPEPTITISPTQTPENTIEPTSLLLPENN